MIPKSLSGASCIVYGAGKTGVSLIRYLSGEGAEIYVSDKKKSENDTEVLLENEGIRNIKYFSYEEPPKADFVFRSPGMRPDTPEITKAVQKGAALTGETELFFSAAKGKIIGITGSDGKTTTSAITAEILKRTFKNGRRRVFLGGNIGVPFTSFLKDIGDDDVTVAELSSFQLMTLRASPYRAAVTNITENHLDWHTSMREYMDAKCQIFENEGCKRLVLNRAAAAKLKLDERRTPKDVIYTSLGGEQSGVCIRESEIISGNERILNVEEILLPGIHNRENFMTAIALTDGMADAGAIRETASDFKGVPHRMQLVLERRGVRFYDSSIDSTPSRSAVTLGCFKRPLTVICGGYDKNLDYEIFAHALSEYADNVVVTGENADKILAAVSKYKKHGLSVYRDVDFTNAVCQACSLGYKSALLHGSANVLLSPASASFDMFENYEERGKRFIKIVNES